MLDFLRLLSCVTSGMLPQIACPRFCKVTQVTKNAFERLFPSVYLIVDSQTTFLWLGLTTFAASISFSLSFCSLCFSKWFLKIFQNPQCLHIEGCSSLCFILCLLRLFLLNEIKLQLLHFFVVTVQALD